MPQIVELAGKQAEKTERYLIHYHITSYPSDSFRRSGTIFWLGGSKSWGPHFEESTNLL